MEFVEQKIKGVFKITMKPHFDARGYFMRTYDKQIFSEMGLDRDWVQENHSYSESKGIIRGLHFQLQPFGETKLVRCTRGAVFDVFVDLRHNSPTFGTWGGLELSERNFNCLFIPAGFAHGFCTLEDQCKVLYKVDKCYTPSHEAGLIWSDPYLNIAWPVKNPVLSDKDSKNLTLKEFVLKYQSIKV